MTSKERLAEYERRPGFRERAAEVEADIRTAAIMGKTIDAGAIADALGLPLDLAAHWIGKTLVACGILKGSITVTGRPS